MSRDPHIEDFDKAMRELMHGAETPVPPGVWEGVASGVGAQATTAVVAGFTKILAIKLAAGIAGISLLSIVGYQLLKSDDKPVELPAENTIEESAPLTRDAETEGVITVEADEPENADNARQAKSVEERAVVNPYQNNSGVRGNSLKGNGSDNSAAPAANDRNAAPNPNDVAVAAEIPELKTSNATPCSGEIFNVSLQGDLRNFTGAEWIINGQVKARGGVSQNFSFEKGLHKIELRGLLNGRKFQREIQIAVREISAEFSYRTEPGVLILSAGNKGNSVWFVDGVQVSGSAGSLHYECANNRNYRIMHVARNSGCSDTVYKNVMVQWDEKNRTESSELIIPNVFSPYEEDGKNDRFEIRVGSDVEEYHLQVLDTRGNTVFETNDPEQYWNGRLMNLGEMVREGWYHYFLFYKKAGTEESRVGKVLLVK
ncbi:MAG: gliding motility-associated C-terminal domain-containing protein [Flavobacteriales bacterium]|nr:gliding motility-associated C-terminal domain-containing protein [Flavobacteriales bacterium]